MTQGEFDFGDPIELVPTRRCELDLGPVANAHSGARHVIAENGHEYIVKGPTLAPDRPYIAANELICARLARAMNLPVLDFCLVEWSGDLMFGAAWMPKDTFIPFGTPSVLDSCQNRDRLYDLALFDAWVCNRDRHGANLPIRVHVDALGTERRQFLLTDHEHCLVAPDMTMDDLRRGVSAPLNSFIFLNYIKAFISDPYRLDESLGHLLSIPFDLLTQIVHSTPDRLMTKPDRLELARFLFERRAFIKSRLADAREVEFPALARRDQ